MKISTAQSKFDNTLHMAKKATAATATKPDKAVHSTVAETPRRSSTNTRALPMISQRRPPRTGIISSGGSG
ncbi:hypothetical protein D3C85_1733220 [compost metagenome]